MRPPPPFLPRALRQWVLVVLAALTALQGATTAALALLGPLHTHQHPARSAPSGVDHVLSAFGHYHAAEAPLRHHHAAGDASVVHDAADSDPGWLASPTLAAFVGLVGQPAAWQPPALTGVAASRPAWQPLTHHPGGIERPPRAG